MRHRSYWCIHLSLRFLSFIHFHLWKSHYFHKSSSSTIVATHSLNSISTCSSVVVHIHFIICIHFVYAHEKLWTKNILKEGSKNLFFENRENASAQEKCQQFPNDTKYLHDTHNMAGINESHFASVRHINAQRLYAGRNPIDHNMIVEKNERKKKQFEHPGHMLFDRGREWEIETHCTQNGVLFSDYGIFVNFVCLIDVWKHIHWTRKKSNQTEVL